MRWNSRLFGSCLALAFAASYAAGEPKELHWRALDVRARLDESGRLRVIERQAMVFTGDWNGGERIFRLERGQKLELEGLSRRDPATGEEHALVPGDLSAVDQYAWKDANTLRWRSRLPSDPLFSSARLDYEIRYVLSGILTREGSEYRIAHDFAFPDRSGAIEKFSLELILDPVWQATPPLPERIEHGPLAPGESFVVSRLLSYRGLGQPVAGKRGSSRAARIGIFAALAAGIVLLLIRFRGSKTERLRWEPVAAPGEFTGDWLRENVFALPPEQVGALWDETIGPPEVAAALARLAQEKKIEANPDGKKMTMRLLVPLDRLHGYEKDLLAGLFFGGRKETDTDAVRAHYKGRGFDPAAKIRPGIETALKSRADLSGGGLDEIAAVPDRRLTLALLGAGVLLLAMSVLTGNEPWQDLVSVAIVHGALYGAALPFAYMFRKRLNDLSIAMLTFLWVPLLFLWFSYRGIEVGGRTSLLFLVGQLLLRLAIVNAILNFARTRSGPRRLERRKVLSLARRFFAGELASRSPRLSDAWYPYVLAFGLGRAADRWARAFGVARSEPSSSSSSSLSGSSGSASPASSGGWSGGGGSFGGAGASTSWAAAAGALAAGVSAPSSGSGGGGGGGGGGSSGGGGGGGW